MEQDTENLGTAFGNAPRGWDVFLLAACCSITFGLVGLVLLRCTLCIGAWTSFMLILLSKTTGTIAGSRLPGLTQK